MKIVAKTSTLRTTMFFIDSLNTRKIVLERPCSRAGWASLLLALQIFRLKTRVLSDTSEHLRTDLIGVVEREDIIRPSLASKGLVGARLTFDMPPDSVQCGENLPGLR